MIFKTLQFSTWSELKSCRETSSSDAAASSQLRFLTGLIAFELGYNLLNLIFRKRPLQEVLIEVSELIVAPQKLVYSNLFVVFFFFFFFGIKIHINVKHVLSLFLFLPFFSG